MDVRLSAPDLFVERSVRSAWRTAEGVGDLLMTDAADRQVLLGRWSQSRRVDAAGWGESRIATVKRPLNHLRALQTRNFVRDDFALYGIISVEYNKSYYGRVVEEGEVVHGGADGAVGGQLEGGAGGVLGVGDQHRLGAEPGGRVGVKVVALLCSGARFEKLAVLDNEGELPLGGWEKFARFVVHL